jgi:hypothetical protein
MISSSRRFDTPFSGQIYWPHKEAITGLFVEIIMNLYAAGHLNSAVAAAAKAAAASRVSR